MECMETSVGTECNCVVESLVTCVEVDVVEIECKVVLNEAVPGVTEGPVVVLIVSTIGTV